MYGRIYTAIAPELAITAQQDLLSILLPADMIVQVHAIGASQSSEVADAAEAMVNLQWSSGATSAGSGGGTVTPVPRILGDVASTCTVRRNDTTKASGGTIVDHYEWIWNIRVPFQNIWTPETRPIIVPSARATLELATTDAFTVAAYIVFEEIG